ncbi:MAG: hypothetical protein HC896_16595 [Bacteroidales bacterium]|nr:hypothetical protein [Bacteroidales bacterium]
MIKKKIAILGSTGSIGKQALEIIKTHSDRFEVALLTAHNNATLLVQQAIDFLPQTVIIANPEKFKEVATALAGYPIKVLTGHDAIEENVAVNLESYAILNNELTPLLPIVFPENLECFIFSFLPQFSTDFCFGRGKKQSVKTIFYH